VLTGEVGDQVRGGVDGSPVDRLHDQDLSGGLRQLACRRTALRSGHGLAA
jgi:hypothetical protein